MYVPRFGNQALSAVRVAEEPQRGDDGEDVGVEPRGGEEGVGDEERWERRRRASRRKRRQRLGR